MPLNDDDAGSILSVHLMEAEEDRIWQRWHRNAYSTDFWAGNCWSSMLQETAADLVGDGAIGLDDMDGLPVKVQVNQIEPFVSSRVANLFYRAPRTHALAPRVLPKRGRGRPKSMTGAEDAVTGYLDDWLTRTDVKESATYGYQMALMYAYSGFKLGAAFSEKGKGSVLERVWVDTLPPWECVLDRRARSRNTEAFRGHFRYELIEDAREIVEDNLDGIETVELPDFLVDGLITRPSGVAKRLKRYVGLFELYDMKGGTQTFYTASGSSASPALRRVGKQGVIPYELPSGRPGVPIEPIVLSNMPEMPLFGLSAVKRVYQLNAEDNLMLTIVVNAMRRDAARIILYLKERGIDQDTIDLIMSGRDLVLAGIPGETLAGLFDVLQMPPLAPTLDKASLFIERAREQTSGSSEFMQGKQLKYASAEEARHVATYGELSVGEVAERMNEALARACETVLAITAAEMDGDIVITGPDGDIKLTKEVASLPWSISISDSASTPTRDSRRKTEFATIQPQMIELARIASTPDAPAVPDPTAPPQPSIPVELKRLAQEQLNYFVALYQLPSSMSWDALSEAGQLAAKEAASAENAARSAEVEGLLARLVPVIAQAQQQPQPEVTGANPTAPLPQV